MKRTLRNFLPIMAIFSTLLIVSCGDEEEVFGGDPDPGSEFDARLNTAFSDSLEAEVFLAAIDDNKIDVFISFSSDDATMRRLYATVNEFGQGEEAFDLPLNADKKADGSLELDGPQGSEFAVNLDISTAGLNAMSGSTIVYKFWTTTGKGDIRQAEKRQATEPMTLTIQLSGTNPDAPLASVSDVRLFAPTADLMSQSFVSTIDGTITKLDDLDLSDLWDIGYSAQADGSNPNGVPRLSSASGSPQRFFFPIGSTTIVSFQELIEQQLGVEAAADLNMVYFRALSNFDFEGADSSADLDAIAVSASDPQTFDIPLTEAAGTLVGFLDQYGKKGIIRIDALVDGNNNGEFFNNTDYVQIDIKVQP